MLVVGRRVLPKVLWWVAGAGSRELFTLCVIAAALGVAYGSAKLFDVSFALGAFFSGMMLRESEYSHRAADESLPLRDAFSVLFFVLVGMLFDPAVLLTDPVKVLAVTLVIMVGKTLAAIALVLLMRLPLNTALTVGVSLAQIGEFSFILAGLGVGLNLLPREGQNLILAGAMLSIACNSLLFAAITPLEQRLRARYRWARELALRPDPLSELPGTVHSESLSGQVVLVGHGRVGSRVADALLARQVPVVVVERRREAVEALRAQHRPAVVGDGAEPSVLIQAHIARASLLVVATPDLFDARKMVEIARALNPGIAVLARGDDSAEAELWRQEQLGAVVASDAAMARELVEQIVALRGEPAVHGGHGTASQT